MKESNKEQEMIIKADLQEQIIVNAPPGTGKTYIVSKKIEYIVKNQIVPLDSILVICFSRSAVKEIKDRIDISEAEKREVTIRTIDSFCSWIIKEIEEAHYKEIFNNTTYDERIKYVLELLKKNQNLIHSIKKLKHIIIDEVQDIVGIRAEFILEMLKIYNLGFTLLGDECQAIYDYQSREMSSKEFYKELEIIFGEIKKVELKKQKRLSPILDKKAVLLRAAIESKDEKLISNLIPQILENIPYEDIENVQEGIILTRKNGKVYDISGNLKVKHNILDNSSNIHYPSWIGYIFGDYTENNIEMDKFEKLIKNKLNISEKEEVMKYWRYCKEIEENTNDILDIQKLHNNIIVSDNINVENIEKNEKVVISTIHKAKGKEFESVYLDKEIEEECIKENIIDYAKLLYVAITRAKNNWYEINSTTKKYKTYYGVIPEEERYFEYSYKRKKYRKGHTDKSIRKIEIGLEKDIDRTSFINDKIVGNAKENIEYIKNKIYVDDYVDLVLEDDKYYIYHKERKIGKMNIENLYENTQKYLNKVRRMSYKPLKYSKVKIKRITTISMFQEFIPSEIQNIYAKTGMWIGIELEGFGKLEWNNN